MDNFVGWTSIRAQRAGLEAGVFGNWNLRGDGDVQAVRVAFHG